MTCRKCGTEIAAKAIICYKCGTATTEPAGGGFNPAHPARNAGAKAPAYNSWLILVVVAAVVAAAVWWFQYR